MVNVGIYNTSWGTFGGGEKYISLIANILSKLDGFNVTLLLDKPSLTRKQLSTFYSIELDNVAVRNISAKDVTDIMSSFDLGIITSNVKTFGNHAKYNIYILQIPYYKLTPVRILGKAIIENPKEGIKDIMRLALLRDARKSDLALVYSEFTQGALQKYHKIDGKILYPPIDDFHRIGAKKKVLLSVGRFFRGVYNDKRYDILIKGFKKLWQHVSDSSWEYHLVGSCGADAKSQRYLDTLRETAKGYPIRFYVNATYSDLQKLYDESTIFWHATGYGVDETRYPERMEHFGMSTVEAMSAKCIPVVINKGGQKEIVTHGETGFLWNTLEELIEYTLQIISDPLMADRIKERARSRYMDFNRDHFSQKLIQLIEKLDIGGLRN